VSRPALGLTQPPIQWVPWDLSQGVKRPERKADHSPPSSAKFKECVVLYLHSIICLRGVVLHSAQGQLYLYDSGLDATFAQSRALIIVTPNIREILNASLKSYSDFSFMAVTDGTRELNTWIFVCT
jgi:hypothetical protein